MKKRILGEVDDDSEDGIISWDKCDTETKERWLREADNLLNLGICPNCEGKGEFYIFEPEHRKVKCDLCKGTGGALP